MADLTREDYRANLNGCLEALYEECQCNHHALANLIGVARPTVTRWLAKHEISGNRRWPDKQPEQTIVKEVEPFEYSSLRRALERREAELKALRVEVKHRAKHENLIDDIRDLLAPVIAANVLPNPKPLKVRPKTKGKPVIYVWHLTDLHWGELVEAATVQYQNAYSPGIAARRVQHVVDTIVEMAEATLHDVEEIVIVINGDTVGGSIHPESAEYYARIVKQCLDASMVLAQVVSELAQRFPKVRYIGTQGNHPRSTHRMPTGSARVSTSFETFIHEQVAALLQRHENIAYVLAQGYTVDTYIGPSRWAFSHGDAVGGGGGSLGIPAYGLKKQHDANREWSVVMAQMSDAAIGNSIVKHTRCGHFHIYFHWFVGAADIALCPSLKGTDTFVKDKLAKYARAQTLVEVVHPDHDVIAHHLIDAQHIMDDSGPCRYHWCALESDQPIAASM